VNGDGRPDALVGAYRADPSGRVESGSAYAVLGFGNPALAYEPLVGSARRPLVAHGPAAIATTGAPTFSVSPPLPAGLELDPRTGAVSGTPAAVGTGSVNVTMTDLAGAITVPLAFTVVPFDGKSPATTLGAKASQRLLQARALYVSGGCDEACTLSVEVVVRASGSSRRVRLITAVRTLTAPKTTNFKVVFAPDAQAPLRALLRGRPRGTAVITLTATDRAGNTSKARLTVPVRA